MTMVQPLCHMDKVLNQALYDKLKRTFGEVAVYSRGEKASYTFNKGSLYYPVTQSYARNVSGGEHYAIKCPFCKRSGKLWLSYLANSYTVEDNIKVMFSRGLIICFRCHFNDDREKLNQFWNMVGKDSAEVSAGFSGDSESPESGSEAPVVFPKTVPILDPSVPNRVHAYLMGRGMDLKELEEVYHVEYSEDSKVLLKGVPRIIFPIIQNGERVAWQGRCLDEDVTRWHIPKYQFPAHAKIKWMLYNSDVARWKPYAVIVEGITDVISCGKAGIAVFGKTVSTRQLEMMRSFWGTRGVIRIPDMDDPEAYTVAKAEVSSWNAANMFKDGAKIVIPPAGKDPGNLTRQEIHDLIMQQTGIDINGSL